MKDLIRDLAEGISYLKSALFLLFLASIIFLGVTVIRDMRKHGGEQEAAHQQITDRLSGFRFISGWYCNPAGGKLNCQRASND